MLESNYVCLFFFIIVKESHEKNKTIKELKNLTRELKPGMAKSSVTQTHTIDGHVQNTLVCFQQIPNTQITSCSPKYSVEY